jgi:AcrR family transcriptional regulator/DNA-binding MarR family transcriptional regulator
MRLLMAMAEVASEHGVANVAVAHVVGRAGVSRRTFYEIFDDRDDCFVACLDEAIARAGRCVSEAYDPQADWVERIRNALLAFLGFLEREPAMGRVAVVESLGAGHVALERRRDALDRLVAEVDRARLEGLGKDCSATSLTAEGLIGGALSVVHARLLSARQGSFTELLNPLMSMIVLPYLGSVAARKELKRPVAKGSAVRTASVDNPLCNLGMRLTYRTVRVLSAVAANPGCSNRLIGDASGVGDQGQISKLLTRLHRLGLIENGTDGSSRSERNAWELTAHGKEVADVVAGRVTHA